MWPAGPEGTHKQTQCTGTHNIKYSQIHNSVIEPHFLLKYENHQFFLRLQDIVI